MFSFREEQEYEGSIRDLAHARSIEHIDGRGTTIVSSPVSSPGSATSSPGRTRRFLRGSPSLVASISLEPEQKGEARNEAVEETKEEENSPPVRGIVSFREEDLLPYRQRMDDMNSPHHLPRIPSEDFNVDVQKSGQVEEGSDGLSLMEEDRDAESPPRGLCRWWKFPVLNGIADCLPSCMTDPIRNPPGWSRTAAFVVRYSPCYWCNRLDTSATDRNILMRLNLICAIFATGQMATALFLFLVLWWDRIADRNVPIDDGIVRDEEDSVFPNLWNLNGNVIVNGMFACFVFVIMFLTRPVVRHVNLVGALRYMWALLWIVPIQLVLTIGLFDVHGVTQVWVLHFWSTPSMAWFREQFCRPSFTANSLCIVPQDGGELFDREEEWCQEFFDQSTCEEVRDDAQWRTERFLTAFYLLCAIWGLVYVFYLVLTVKVLEGIISKPIVQASRESNVPAWLTLPIIGCLGAGILMAFSPNSVFSTETGSRARWIAIVYIVVGVLFAIAAALGWFMSVYAILNNRDKRNKSFAALLFIFVMVTIVIAVSVLFVVSILFSVSLAEIPLSDADRGKTACVIDSGNSCTQCGNDEGLRECPEWSSDDVVAVQRTSLKLSVTSSAIFWVYAVSALRFGIMLRKHIMMYQIAYI